MNRHLTDKALQDLNRNVIQCLNDTFGMMFNIGIDLLPSDSLMDADTAVNAYMDLVNEEAKAFLMINISKTAVQEICADIHTPEEIAKAEVLQDTVCEITNIIGNHLRTYMCDDIGIDIHLSLPKNGLPTAPTLSPPLINMIFEIKKNGKLRLQFCYALATEKH